MINVTVFYPNTAGKTFDLTYYCDQHIPLVRQKLGAACKSVRVEAGLSGVAPGSPAAYTTICHLFFDSVEAFQAVFAPNAQALIDDIPNFTDIQPIMQLSDVKM